MKVKDIIVYIWDNKIGIIYKNSDKTANHKVKNKLIKKDFESIDNGFIVDKEKFMYEFLNVMKKEKIKGKLLGDKISIVKESFYTFSDVYFLESVFNELGFIKVNFIDIRIFFDREATYIEINKKYMIINLDKGLYLELIYYKDIPKIIEYFKEYIKKDIILYGTYKDIPNIKVRGLNVYFMDNRMTYITDCLLKVKK